MAKPTSIKILQTLYLIGGIILGGLGILLISGSFVTASVPLVSVFAGIGGAILAVIGAFYFLMYYGFKKGKNWARILAIIGSIIGLIGVISSLATIELGTILTGVWNGYILYSLGLDKKTIRYFK